MTNAYLEKFRQMHLKTMHCPIDNWEARLNCLLETNDILAKYKSILIKSLLLVAEGSKIRYDKEGVSV